MNILLISPHFYPAVGGVETHLKDLCEYLTSQKHRVYVRTYQALASKVKGKISEENNYLKIHRLPWPDFNLYFKLDKYPFLKFIYVFTGLFLDSLIFMLKNSNRIDVIQAHGFISAGASVILGKIFHKRVVINTHVDFKFYNNFMTKVILWTLEYSNEILVLTKGAKDSLVQLGIPEEKIEVYRYWVNQKIFNKQKDAKKKLCWENKFVVLFVGRLIKIKGVDKIFELADRLKGITFVIAGKGPLSENLRQKSLKYENIIFVGGVENNNLSLYYSGADALLLPSKIIDQEYEEGIPRVMIEALSCGLPVISTKSGGIPEVFSNKIGILVDDNLKSMEKALNHLYTNKTNLKSLAQNCRSFALKYFSKSNAQIIQRSLLDK